MCVGATLSGCHLGFWYGGAGLTRVRHDAEAWVPVAGCGMVRHGAENRKAVSLIITLYYAVVQGMRVHPSRQRAKGTPLSRTRRPVTTGAYLWHALLI